MLASLRNLARFAREDGARMAIRDPDLQLSYGELAVRVGGFVTAASDLPATVGVLAENGVQWAIADLGLAAAGRTFVPLPPGFSDQQLRHIVDDAGVEMVLVDVANAGRTDSLGVAARSLEAQCARAGGFDIEGWQPAAGVNRIIYTSGTTGTPKGVRLGHQQIDFMTRALADAVGATHDDRYMSVLPMAMLLEQFGAIHVPVLVGGESCLVPSVAQAVGRGQPADIAGAAREARPTFTVIVPALLRLWLAGLATDERPDGLRYVAVGGAHAGPALMEAARMRDIPVHEGYGLSECCSVVALNRPGENTPGTVGRPLDGVGIEIADDGEIIVLGPSVMAGYLGGEDTGGRWATGDLGTLDAAGHLTILGRRDSMLVTEFGRNVSPEWIESLFMSDPRVAQPVLSRVPDIGLAAVIGLTEMGMRWRAQAGASAAEQLVAAACAGAPDYARPKAAVVLSMDELEVAGVLGPGGRINRAEACRFAGEMLAQPRPLHRTPAKPKAMTQEAAQ